MKISFYKCSGITSATDSANIYYINRKDAQRIEKNPTERKIKVFNKSGLIAVFSY